MGAIGRTALGSLAGLLAAPGPAAAAWMKASTPHFNVYADAKEATLRKQAAELELFDAALRRFQNVPDTPDARHNKVTVFVLPSKAAVQKLIGRESVAGFYLPRVEGSVAFTPREDEDGGGINALSPRIVLFTNMRTTSCSATFRSPFRPGIRKAMPRSSRPPRSATRRSSSAARPITAPMAC